MDDLHLPAHVKFWINYPKKDCFFNVGQSFGPNEHIGAIKILLMGHSEPFYSMLEESDMAEKGEIALPDIEPKSFKDFLTCVYGGSDVVLKHLTFEECVKLLYITDKYLVAQVKRDVLTKIEKLAPLSVSDLFVALKSPVCLQDETVNKIIAESIKSDTDKIFSDKRFMDISSEALLIIVKQESLNVKELDVYKAVVEWAENKSGSKDGSILREYISEHLPFIRFRVMSIHEFSVHVIPTDILTAEDACKMCTSIASNEPHELSVFSNNRNERFNQILHSGMRLVYSCIVENVCDNKQYNSSYTELGKNSLQISLEKVDGFLGVFLYCKPHPKVERPWECNVTAKLILVNQCGKEDYFLTLTYKFIDTTASNGRGFRKFKEWAEVVDPTQGFIKHGSITIVADITLS